MAERLISSVLEKLSSITGKNGSLIKGSNLQEWDGVFTTIHASLQEAETKFGMLEWTDWFRNLKELAYQIENLLDQQIAEAITSQIEAIDDEDGDGVAAEIGDKVRNFFLPCIRFEKLRRVHKRRLFRERLDTITKDKDRFDRSLEVGIHQTSFKIDEQVEIFGRNEDKDRIINYLLNNEGSEGAVISLVGKRGIGKTTLAQLVFNDERVKSHFDGRIWVSLSYTGFDLVRIAASIIKSVTADTLCQPSDMDQFETRLRQMSDMDQFETILHNQAVRGKRVLLVLDDLKIGDIDSLSQLRRVISQVEAEGGRILITTQNMKVEVTCHCHHLEPLDADAYWSLFYSVAFPESRTQILENEDLKRDVIDGSGGIPLLAKALGHAMYWCKMRKSVFKCPKWVTHKDYDLHAHLALSQVYSSHIKRCLKYCSLFPVECWFEKEVLIQLWMAQGFIPSTYQGPDMEEIGETYFNVLLDQGSFFPDIEEDEDGCTVRYRMREEFFNFLHYFGEPECFLAKSCLEEGESNATKVVSFLSSVRHYSLLYSKNTTSIIPSPCGDIPNMRTVLLLGNPRQLEVPRDLFTRFKFIRALDLSSTKLSELSRSIENLKHLRYLNLSHTRIKKLPESLCGLCFLQTLKLSGSQLCELPKGMRKLINLRHLEIHGTHLSYLPYGMKRLTRMRKLSEFIIGGESGCRIGELRNLELLCGSLIISNLDRLMDGGGDEAAEANLSKKCHLNHLVLDGKKHFSLQSLDSKRHFNFLTLERMHKEAIDLKSCNESDMKRVEGVFEGIKPHVNLRRLEIWNYIGPKFPKWMEEPLLINLVSLKLVKCLKVKYLPPLGKLPSLKRLLVRGMVGVELIDGTFYGDGDGEVKGFPKLERLVLDGMTSLKEWNSSVEEGEMPCVSEIVLSNCPNLRTVPPLPSALRKLEILNCDALHYNQSLQSVEHLVLRGKDGMLCSLPNAPKLMSLKITLSSELKSFPYGLGQINTLRTLTIQFCPKLGSLPKELQHITTLHELHIVGCPLLTEQLQKDRSEELLKIAHIPNIEIDKKNMVVSLSQSQASSSYTLSLHEVNGDD